jgi:hypothetical protein
MTIMSGIFAVVVVSVTACLGLAAPPASAAAEDLVSGSAKVNFGPKHGVGQVIVNAHGNMHEAHGHITARFPDSNDPDRFNQEAEVDCVAVSGNSARVSGPLKAPIGDGSDGGLPVTHLVVEIEDNGTPGSGEADRVAVESTPLFDATAPLCAFPVRFSAFPIESGNYTVTDG